MNVLLILYQGRNNDRWKKQSGLGAFFILLEELVILLVQADGVLAPELLGFVHRTPFKAAGLELRAVLIKGAVDQKIVSSSERHNINTSYSVFSQT